MVFTRSGKSSHPNNTVRHKVQGNLSALKKLKYGIRALKGNSRYTGAFVANKLFPLNDPSNNRSTRNITAMINALMNKQNAADKKLMKLLPVGKFIKSLWSYPKLSHYEA